MQGNYSYQQSGSHQASKPLSSTSTLLNNYQSDALLRMVSVRNLSQSQPEVSDAPAQPTLKLAVENNMQKKPSRKRKAGDDPNPRRFQQPPHLNLHANAGPSTTVREYMAGLTPALSEFRPHVPAKDRLHLWIPATLAKTQAPHLTSLPSASTDEQSRIKTTMLASWDESTRITYGSGLLVFHVFCDRRNTAEEERAPASADLVKIFISSIAGSYSGKTIASYTFGVRAWHKLHGLPWEVADADLEILLRAAEKTAPPSSKRKKRKPITPDFITTIRGKLQLDNPRHAAVFACLTTTFYAAARLGEFTVPNLATFSPTTHVKPSDVKQDQDRSGNEVTIFRLPKTKTKIDGEEVFWATQEGPTDPRAAWFNHLEVNAPPANGHLFAYRHKDGHRPLTKPEFLKVVNGAARTAALEPMHGHSIRIGATLEYILRGMSFEAMKAKGRWSSDAFSIYLTQHAQILAPYIQAHPRLHESFLRATITPRTATPAPAQTPS
ncbi:hypothetical protein M378DRAFT_13874 [Amanita muscaria Koide BX008]|uniref:Tyr recombinase domain-containing protein n=1 Tax=Amanita muscaria (strain Koide BX008) TaxID=946122 RepID=A0A0C2SCX1_AMAMK|nr:hypothetical protein M378DRAFT_13874 [Amanita muscaria Koide BX008]